MLPCLSEEMQESRISWKRNKKCESRRRRQRNEEMDSHLGDVCGQVAKQGHGRLPGQVRLAEVCAGSQEQLQDLMLAAPEWMRMKRVRWRYVEVHLAATWSAVSPSSSLRSTATVRRSSMVFTTSTLPALVAACRSASVPTPAPSPSNHASITPCSLFPAATAISQVHIPVVRSGNSAFALSQA